MRQPRALGRCSPFGRREFRHRRWRRRERSPTVLAKYSHRKDRQGFPWPFARLRRVVPARENPRDARGAARGGTRDEPAGSGASRYAGQGRWQVAGGLPTVVRYGTPGFPKTAESWPANRGNLFAGGAGGTAKLVQQTSVTPNARYDIAGWLGGTRPAPRNSPFSSRAQAGEFSLRPRSGRPGNRRSQCSITGRRPARFPRARRGPG